MAAYSENMYPSVCVEAVEKLGQVTMYGYTFCKELGWVAGYE